MDDGVAEAVETLNPENFSNLSRDKIKGVQQVIIPDIELREVSRSLCTVADAVQGYEETVLSFS